jgi:hypothetical protein
VETLSEDIVQLTAVGSGGTGALSYHWSNDQTGPVIQVDSPDAYVVTVTDEIGCAASASYEYVGISEWMYEDIQIYPNPAIERITIRPSAEGGQITIINSAGQIVLSSGLIRSVLEIDIATWSSGVYTVQYTGESGRRVNRSLSVIR